RAEVPARRQALLPPPCNAAFEIGSVHASAAEACRHALADLVAVRAIDDDRTAGDQVPGPALDLDGVPAQRADDEAAILAEGFLAANVEQQRRGRSAQTRIQIG